MPEFAHLHVHSQYSLLDGASSIEGMMAKAKEDGMKAIALTDHGNLFGAFNFVSEAVKVGLKAMVGCEFYVVEDRHKKSFQREQNDVRYHQLLLAKDQEGYQNLAKLCSLGYIEGMYSKWPRVDKELIEKYHKGLIATTCCVGAEIPQAILHKTEEEAEEQFKWWLDLFGEDYYIELQRHGLENMDGTGKSQEDINQVLLKWAKKHNVKVIASNDSHYIEQSDANAHDILLCVNTAELQATPIGDGKGKRFGFPNDRFYFKTQEEMNELFADVPEAIDNTMEIADKITTPQLKRDILLPNFPLPQPFADADEYLRHLTYEGAHQKYEALTPEIEERLNYELHVIKTMGFAGYFLIVSDFIRAGRERGVAVGPGRGSAAGSAVAFCIGITNIDPIKYDLLFERFLNPERVTMPDIDTDFDDIGRDKVIEYVVEKYGREKVAQIITYGTMAARSSIKDVARVLNLPLNESNMLAKLVPGRPGVSLAGIITQKDDKIKEEFSGEDLEGVRKLRDIAKGDSMQAKVIEGAVKLEGSIRSTGVHAAGVIIAPDDLTKFIPVAVAKDANLNVTQFDGSVIESTGMLKMDFLGLKTLSIIREALSLIEKNHAANIDIDKIPLDDIKTFEMYQKGDTVGTFQFESDGMRKYLKELKPTGIEDLIAMNALFRPGPMDYIPMYIKRKLGKEKVEYPHALLEPILKNTYGIMIYQEQIMQAAQIVAGYTLGGADLLRRAMGKKDAEKMKKERSKFIEGAVTKNGLTEEQAGEIFDIMEKFANYGFNRSHSAAYSVVAYQTAWLKANYPAEYMAAVLTHNMGTIEKITFFMDECRRQGIQVLGPDINESSMNFAVNRKGMIRFGLAAIKGTGDAAVESIITERETNGPFKDIFDFAGRINLRAVNKKTFESLAQAGAFDCFPEIHRAQYFYQEQDSVFLEKIIKYGAAFQNNASSTSVSLFGGADEVKIATPKFPDAPRWSNIESLTREKEVVGFYISGHPLDEYRLELKSFCNSNTQSIKPLAGKTYSMGGIISKVTVRKSQNGNEWAAFSIEDYEGNTEFRLFSGDFIKFRNFMEEGLIIWLKITTRERYNGEVEFQVADIMLLNDIAKKLTKNITLKIALANVNHQLIDNLEMAGKKYKGSIPLKFDLFDPEEGKNLPLFSEKLLFEPGKELFRSLQGLENVEVGLN